MGGAVVAVAMVKDEADVIETTVLNMLRQCDHVIVADNGSTDGTREILASLPIELVDDPDPAYFQAFKTTKLAHLAGERGAEWVVPFDADEFWCSAFGLVKDALRQQVPERYAVVGAALYDHMATGRDPQNIADPMRRMRYHRAEPLPLPKVAARYAPNLEIRQGNHSAGYDIEPAILINFKAPILVIRHFPYRSVRQFIRKVRNGAAAYAATGDALPSDIGDHWRKWGMFSDEQLDELFRTWYYRADPHVPTIVDNVTLPALVLDPCPIEW